MKKHVFIFFIAFCVIFAVSPGYSAKKSHKKQMMTVPLEKQFKLDDGIRFLKLGNTYREAGNLKESEFYMTKGFNIIAQYDEQYWLAACFEYFGYLARDLGNKEEALDNFKKAQEMFSSVISMENGSPSALNEVINSLEDGKHKVKNVHQKQNADNGISSDEISPLSMSSLSQKTTRNALSNEPGTTTENTEHGEFLGQNSALKGLPPDNSTNIEKPELNLKEKNTAVNFDLLMEKINKIDFELNQLKSLYNKKANE